MEIGVPTRFSTPRADIDVVTRAARAPALLTAYKVDAAGERLQVDLHLQTGTRTTDRQTLAGIVQGPFKSVTGDGAVDGNVLLPAVAGVQYFLHSYYLGARLLVTDTTTHHGFRYYLSPVAYLNVALPTVPLAVGSPSVSGVLDVLTYPGMGVLASVGVASPQDSYLTLTYAIVSGVM